MEEGCTKIRFNTSIEANAELRRILETTRFKPWKDKKPSRIYECEKCKGWHLTSKVNYKWNQNQTKL